MYTIIHIVYIVRRSYVLQVMCLLLEIGIGPARADEDVREQNTTTSKDISFESRLQQLVPDLRKSQQLVGLGATLMVDGQVVAAAVDGERSVGSNNLLQLQDRWHIGSITKSITATLVGRLIEKKQIDWTTTLEEVFGETLTTHPAYRSVTMEQFLTHRSGAPANFSLLIRLQKPEEGKVRTEARRRSIGKALHDPPQNPPGTAFLYSNVGFTVAGTMLEQRTSATWEELIRREIFAPLQLTDAGFGPPRDEGNSLDQPRGHVQLGRFKQVMGTDADNTPIMGPAGTVHMTMAELCSYGNDHLQGERGNGKLLTAETYRRLHQPHLDHYACGWVVPETNRWTDQKILWHNGSNTMWYALLVLLPESHAVLAVVANDGDMPQAGEAGFQILKELAPHLTIEPDE